MTFEREFQKLMAEMRAARLRDEAGHFKTLRRLSDILADEHQKDRDEYVEENSLGGKQYRGR